MRLHEQVVLPPEKSFLSARLLCSVESRKSCAESAQPEQKQITNGDQGLLHPAPNISANHHYSPPLRLVSPSSTGAPLQTARRPWTQAHPVGACNVDGGTSYRIFGAQYPPSAVVNQAKKLARSRALGMPAHLPAYPRIHPDRSNPATATRGQLAGWARAVWTPGGAGGGLGYDARQSCIVLG